MYNDDDAKVIQDGSIKIEHFDKKYVEQIDEILKQNEKILEMNSKIVRAIVDPPKLEVNKEEKENEYKEN